MNRSETTVQFACAGDWLMGVAHGPAIPCRRGMVIITGGPQYRVGSHRQFTLLARKLAAQNFAVLRFDYRGMGDSEGEPRSFERVDSDIRAAVDALIAQAPALKEVVLWGLCDAASAAMFYAYQDSRVTGMVLLNPWVRSESGIAGAYLKHYYGKRFFDRELWRKIFRGEFKASEAITSFFDMLRARFGGGESSGATPPFTKRMLQGLQRFRGRVLLILSGNDLTAAEFNDLVAKSREWRDLLHAPRVTRRELIEANHTFAREEWRAQVEDWTLEWMQSW
ncbi:MAG: hydrolase 1, exosortase A system-associated [Burkholderiales bacterium]